MRAQLKGAQRQSPIELDIDEWKAVPAKRQYYLGIDDADLDVKARNQKTP
jgi:hypothetical protein